MKKLLISIVLMFTSLSLAVSPVVVGYVTSISVEVVLQPDDPGTWLYWYHLDEFNYPTIGMFVVCISAFDVQGAPVAVPAYEVQFDRMNIIVSENSVVGYDYIGCWDKGDIKRKGDISAIVYPDKAGQCYGVFGFIFMSGRNYSTETQIDYGLSVPELEDNGLVLQTQWRSYKGFSFWHQYYGSRWVCCISSLTGEWSTGLANISSNPPTVASTPAILSNISWPTLMYNISMTKLSAEAATSLQSYTASWPANGTALSIPIFIVGYDANNPPVKTFCKAHKVNGLYITDHFMPVKSKQSQVYTDPNTGITYRTVFGNSFDIEPIREMEFFTYWLTDDTTFDFNKDGVVNFKDYSMLF
jgi:hypothetical protein